MFSKDTMTITEKVSNYFDRQIAAGLLRPGDRLPKYEEICRIFDIPYSSVQRAFKAMEHSGKIKIINGVGSFLNGGDTLAVDFFAVATTFELSELQRILNEISEKNNLYLNIRVKDIKGKDLVTNTREHKVIISESDRWANMPGCLMDYSEFEDYEEFITQFNRFPDMLDNNLQLPYYVMTTQSVVNPILLKKLSLENTITSVSNFEWWDELVEQCRKHHLAAAYKCFETKYLGDFPMFDLAVLLMMQGHEDFESLFKVPFFATPTGLRMFQICRDMKSVPWSEAPFLRGESVFEMGVGSWITVQHQRKFNCDDAAFQIIPWQVNGRKLLRADTKSLQTFVNQTISDNEKKRIWVLLKELLSRKYQKKIMALGGMVSPRKDMKPKDHEWFYREDFAHFFPGKNDLLFSGALLTEPKLAVLATLYEQYEVYDADLDMIRKCMDLKLISN